LIDWLLPLVISTVLSQFMQALAGDYDLESIIFNLISTLKVGMGLYLWLSYSGWTGRM